MKKRYLDVIKEEGGERGEGVAKREGVWRSKVNQWQKQRQLFVDEL